MKLPIRERARKDLESSDVVRPGSPDAEHPSPVRVVEVRIVDVPETRSLEII
jgi:hypothetical protein